MAAKVRVVVEVLVNVGRAQARGKRASFVLVDERQNAATADVVLKPMESHDVEVQFGEAARAAHDTVYGGIRGRAVRRTVSDDNHERGWGEYRVRRRRE